MEPRHVIGSVDTSELAVSVAASLGFLVGLGAAGISWTLALRPARRWAGRRPARRVPRPDGSTHLLGVAVGGMILLGNVRTRRKRRSCDPPQRPDP